MGKHLLPNKRSENLKKILQKSERMHKLTTTKRIEPKKLIQHATNNLNSIASQKYDVLPNFVEENKQQDEKFHKIFNF